MIITISRQYGAGGSETARRVAARVPGGTVPKLQETDLVRITETVVAELAAKGKVVLVGRAAPAVLARERDSLHVQLVAPRTYRIAEAAERLGVDPEHAARMVDETDRTRASYLHQHYGRDWYDPVNYHMVLNTGLLGVDGVTELILREAGRRGWLPIRS